MRMRRYLSFPICSFFNDTATTEIYTLSLHAALPIFVAEIREGNSTLVFMPQYREPLGLRDRKSTRLNSSHRTISYAFFCLKKILCWPGKPSSRDGNRARGVLERGAGVG